MATYRSKWRKFLTHGTAFLAGMAFGAKQGSKWNEANINSMKIQGASEPSQSYILEFIDAFSKAIDAMIIGIGVPVIVINQLFIKDESEKISFEAVDENVTRRALLRESETMNTEDLDSIFPAVRSFTISIRSKLNEMLTDPDHKLPRTASQEVLASACRCTERFLTEDIEEMESLLFKWVHESKPVTWTHILLYMIDFFKKRYIA
jgi:hypothetical protein